jgi:hypothetical protein
MLLGIEKEVSGFSFMSKSGSTVYLEEDCDGGLFCKACEKLGIDYLLVHVLPSSLRLSGLQGYLWK